MDAEPGPPAEGVTGLPVLTGSAAPAPPEYIGALPKGPAARFFTAVFLSLYGDWLSTVALLVVLFESTRSPVAPAGYMLARVAPRVFGPLWGGQFADRLSPRVVMILTSAVQALFTASLIASHRAEVIWAIYAAVVLAQFSGALGRPSQSAILPSLVNANDLPRANATYWLLFSTSIFVAPALGAALLTRLGPDALFAIDAATFAIAAFLIATLGLPERPDVPSVVSIRREGTLGAVRSALRHPAVRMVAASNFASGLTVTVTQAFLVVAAHERYGGDAAVGYLYSSVGIGGTVGGLIALRRVPSRHWTRFAMFVGIIVNLVTTAAFSASTVAVLALLMLAVGAVAGTSLDTWGATEVQRQAPPGFMGRYNSIIFISMYSGMLVGALWALGTSSVLHWDVAIEVACAAMLVLVGLVWISGGKASSTRVQAEP